MTDTEALKRFTEVMRRQHKALSTERTYRHWLKQYMVAVRDMPRDSTSEQRLERFLTDLALRRDVAASTQNQAFNAIVSFYKDTLGRPLANVDALRAQRPAHLRHAPTVDETRTLLASVRDAGGYPVNLVVQLLYGAGLRVSEAVSLRIKDVRIAESQLFILGAKGGKDRVVRLPCSLASQIEQQMEAARVTWRRDVEHKLPIQLPHQLARKYPEYEFSWGWAWLFPLRHPCKDPRSDRWVRWHMLPDSVQRAVKRARRETGVMVVPHELRHAYATHNLNRGVNIKALSQAMGHAQIETTSGYCHAEALSVPSPLEMMA
jgi:integron integrase